MSLPHRQIFSSFGAKRQWWYYEVVKLVVYNKVYSPIFFFSCKIKGANSFQGSILWKWILCAFTALTKRSSQWKEEPKNSNPLGHKSFLCVSNWVVSEGKIWFLHHLIQQCMRREMQWNIALTSYKTIKIL